MGERRLGAVHPSDTQRWWLGSAALARGLVLVHHAGRDPAALTDRQAMLFRPGPDITRTLPTRCGPPGAAGMLDVGRELLAQRSGVLGVQVDLIIRALEGEPQPRHLRHVLPLC